MKKAEPASPTATTFEQGVEKLEEIVKSLEEQEIPLEKALNLFREGVELVQYCSRQLDQGEKQMEILLEEADGKLRVEAANLQTEG
ncbi:MAG: exodeoxyribonuclease VII small subunit [Peptococcaceae bacterium]|jgi:exodeoxyribonuclease VII small subunit|nr:exodeoxyribonuclease VII small subunit [Peptococcaceae bacterium]